MLSGFVASTGVRNTQPHHTSEGDISAVAKNFILHTEYADIPLSSCRNFADEMLAAFP